MLTPALTSADRLALRKLIRRHPKYALRFKSAWQLKHLGDRELLETVRDLGLTYESSRERLREAADLRRQVARLFPAPPSRPQGAFSGVLVFPLKMEVLGREVVREARLVWGYTPPWDYSSPRGGSTIVGDLEALEYAIEVRAEVPAGALKLNRTGDFRSAQKPWTWKRIDLAAIGVLPEELHEEWRSLIDAETRRQDQERREGTFYSEGWEDGGSLPPMLRTA